MTDYVYSEVKTARLTGGAILLTILLGILGSLTLKAGIDVNLNADFFASADAAQNAELRSRGAAYFGLFMFAMDMLVVTGFFLLLRQYGLVMAWWAFLISLGAFILSLLGTVSFMNLAIMSTETAFESTENNKLAAAQTLTDYTSFHLGLILSSAAKIIFFVLFWRAAIIPKLISGWGVFASAFVVIVIVLRDFIPALGSDPVTAAFMLSNLTALIALGLYLIIKGVRLVK